jgi:hypothetical protein
LPAGEDEEGLLAEVMLFFLKICGYYFVVLRISVTYPLIIHNHILEKTLPRPSNRMLTKTTVLASVCWECVKIVES